MKSPRWLIISLAIGFFPFCYYYYRSFSDYSWERRLNHSPGDEEEHIEAYEIMFKNRRDALKRTCLKEEIVEEAPMNFWNLSFISKELLHFCVPPKAGSTSWRDFLVRKKWPKITRKKHIYAMVVRHPLDRLASVYRDKFVDGNPIIKYLDRKKKDASVETLSHRWTSYWLPALIQQGLVAPTKIFQNSMNAFQQRMESYKQEKQSVQNVAKYKLKEISYKENLSQETYDFFKGRPKATYKLRPSSVSDMEKAVKIGYPQIILDRLLERFQNFSFKFVDFLNFIIWSFETKVPNVHWIPITDICHPCLIDYDYIFHMKNMTKESHYFLNALTRSKQQIKDMERSTKFGGNRWKKIKGLKVDTVHVSISSRMKSDYLSYYIDVPQNVFENIKEIYKNDLAIFTSLSKN